MTNSVADRQINQFPRHPKFWIWYPSAALEAENPGSPMFRRGRLFPMSAVVFGFRYGEN